MKFDQEKIRGIKAELEPLLYAHWREIAHYQDIVLNPSWDMYFQMDESGFARMYTARTDDGALVGYAVFFVKHNLHYSDSLQAVQDILFIHPTHRGFGAEFIEWCDKKLREDGVQVVHHHVKAAHNFGPLLKRLGYEMVERIWSRRLD